MSRSIHIVQTVGSIAERSGGPARTIRDLSEALGRAGARVSLVAAHDPARDDALLPPDPALATTVLVPVVRRVGWPSQDFASAIGKLVRPGERAIVHDNGIWSPANIAVGAAVRRHRLPLVISPHGMLEPWAMAWHRGRKRIAWHLFQHRLLAGARGIAATASGEADAIRALFPAAPVATIANGVNCPATVPDRASRDTASRRTVLFLSRLHPKKNLPGLIDAWALLAADPRFANWHLRIAGPDEGGHRAVLATRIAAAGLETRIQLDGPVREAEKAAAFAEADVFILPTFSENFGIVVAEALAHGVPAIATTGTPWGSLAREGCGWQVPPDPASLAAALRAAMTLSPAQRRSMGERGHALVAREFGWTAIADKTLAYYDWLLDGGSAPGFVDV